MHKLMLAAVAAALLTTSTGCNCLSRLFCHSWDGCGLWSGCYDTCCGGDWTTDGYGSPGCGHGGIAEGGCGCHAGPLYGGFWSAHRKHCPDGSCAKCYHPHGHGLGERIAGNREAAMAGVGYDVTNAGAVAYPYYTTRGPRDFLLDDPPSIGR